VYILDTCAFLTQNHPEGEIATISEIESELNNRQSKQYFTNMKEIGLKIREPKVDSIENIRKNSEETGDLGVLSSIDLKILALAYEMRGTIVSDDFAIQNVALHMGVEFTSCSGNEIKELRKWKYRCSACRAEALEKVDSCSVCGSEKIFRFKAK